MLLSKGPVYDSCSVQVHTGERWSAFGTFAISATTDKAPLIGCLTIKRLSALERRKSQLAEVSNADAPHEGDQNEVR